MKRTGDLKKLWCTYENLYAAFLEVKKRKSYHKNFIAYENNLAVNLSDLLQRLEEGTYRTRPYRSFYVYDPKQRLIEAPYLEDRIVQHALLRATRKLIENRFIGATYACIKKRGTHAASDKLQQMLKQFRGGYYLKIDIKKYFYSIPHNVVSRLLSQIIKCRHTLKLFNLFLADAKNGIGLPLGSVTSQVLANLALNSLDHFIKRVLRIKYYVRYMDDMVLLHADKSFLRYALDRIRTVVVELGLSLNNKTKISQIAEGIDFVGYRTRWNSRIIRKRSLFKIKRTVKKDASIQRISSYLAHAKETASLEYVCRLIAEVIKDNREFLKYWLHKNVKGELCLSI